MLFTGMDMPSTFFKESNTQLGVFYPKHYLIAVFEDAQAGIVAERKLIAAGFADDETRTFLGEEMIGLTQNGAIGSSFIRGLSRLLGTEEVYTARDLRLAQQGASFVAVHCHGEEIKERAWRLLQPEGPVAARYYAVSGIEHLAGDLFT